MGLLHEIQEAIVDPEQALGPILLKLRLLAARLGSGLLGDWVRHEAEGYPVGVEVPDYRRLPLSYSGTFAGSFGQQLNNVPIPIHLISKYAGEKWVSVEVRESIAAIDNMLSDKVDLGIDASNLILILRDRIYAGMSPIVIESRLQKSALEAIRSTVRARILELTVKLEQEIPDSTAVGTAKPLPASSASAEKLAQVVNMTVYGPNTVVTSFGDNAVLSVTNAKGDTAAIVDALTKAGLPTFDAREFAEAVSGEQPESQAKPFGPKAKQWLAKNIGKAADGTWKVGLAVATKVLEEVALRFYGFK